MNALTRALSTMIKGVLLGLILFYFFAIVLGCSDSSDSSVGDLFHEPSESSSHTETVRFTESVYEAQKGAKKSGRSENIKKDLSFAVHTYSSERGEITFSVPLEENILDDDAYHVDIQFLEPQTKAMKHLKEHFKKTGNNPNQSNIGVRRFCYFGGTLLNETFGVRGTKKTLPCDFNDDSDTNVVTVQRSLGVVRRTNYPIQGLYRNQEPITGDEAARIANMEFKSVLILFKKNASGDITQPSNLDVYSQYDFGYRCLLDKKESRKTANANEGIVKYHHCRYPKK